MAKEPPSIDKCSLDKAHETARKQSRVNPRQQYVIAWELIDVDDELTGDWRVGAFSWGEYREFDQDMVPHKLLAVYARGKRVDSIK